MVSKASFFRTVKTGDYLVNSFGKTHAVGIIYRQHMNCVLKKGFFFFVQRGKYVEIEKKNNAGHQPFWFVQH